jgi:transposase
VIQLVPHMHIRLAVAPVDFRKGIDSLVALCRAHWQQDPLDGTLFVFRNRTGTAVKLLVYDGQGFWLCLKRFSQGHLQGWPAADTDALQPLAAQQLLVLLYNGQPHAAAFADDWRPLK